MKIPQFLLFPAALITLTLVTGFVVSDDSDSDKKWVPLFNGKDLSGWTPKIRYEKYGEDSRNTFRVKDGLLQVGYENYDEFNETFGHLFYEVPYSDYRIRLEYRFIGEQLKGGPSWAYRNSGIMVHGQDPETMVLDQDFPVSISKTIQSLFLQQLSCTNWSKWTPARPRLSKRIVAKINSAKPVETLSRYLGKKTWGVRLKSMIKRLASSK